MAGECLAIMIAITIVLVQVKTQHKIILRY